MSEETNKEAGDLEEDKIQDQDQVDSTPQPEEESATEEPLEEEDDVAEEQPVEDTETEAATEEATDSENAEASESSTDSSEEVNAEVSEDETSEPKEEITDTPVENQEVASVEESAETTSTTASDAQEEQASDEKPLEEPVQEAEPAVEQEASNSSEESQEETNESHDEEEDDEVELPDFSTYTREQLVETVEELSKIDKFKRIDSVLAEVEPLFKAFEDAIRSDALAKYIEDGGEEESFEFRHDDLYNRFDASVKLIRDKRSAFYREKEAAKTRNLEKKQELLEQLRNLVDGEEATTNIKPIKEIQEAWKSIGPVPTQHNKTLWANYNALLDRFYHNRHILFELKDLDRKKNHAAKLELCEKAEALDKLENVKDAVIQLNELHEEYKRIGAVPREVQEELWQRFKGASDVIYRKRKEFLEHLKGDLKENLVKKEALIQELEDYTNFGSDRINDWNAKTKEILALQKRWEALGGVPREKAKEINKAFWSSFKKFFAHKNEFFKKLESLRKENLQKKEELVKEAIALQESEEWDKTSEALKQLQRKWKEIGPVPEKHRNEVYARFKEACDTFFNNRRSQQNKSEAEYVENQKQKEAVLAKITEQAKAGDTSEEALMNLISEYSEFGFVPRNAIKTIEVKLEEAVATYVKSIGLNEEEEEALMLKAQVTGGARGGGADKKLQKKEAMLRRQINELEDNISLWNNNLTFFANSKTADKLKDEFDEKIGKAQEEVQKLKKQLRVLRSI